MNRFKHNQMILTCKQFGALTEIVKAGNVQGAHVCDSGNWSYMGIPANCDKDCNGPHRLINADDLLNAEIVFLCECSYDMPECDGRICGNDDSPIQRW